MKIGIIGFGSIGKRHIDNLQAHGADIVILSQRRDVEGHDVVNSWDDLKVQGPFDALFVTNETHKHVDTIGKCLDLNPKALFVEKPISHTLVGLEEIKNRVEEMGISCFVAYNWQFSPIILRVKEILAEALLGDLYYMRVSVGQDLRRWRSRDYKLCYSSKKDGGGGVMLDLVHDINYPAWLLGESLHAKACVTRKLSDLEIDTEDFVESILESDSGVLVTVHQDYLRTPYDRSLEISGSTASLTWNSEKNTIVVKNNDAVLVNESFDGRRDTMYEDEVAFFVESLNGEKYINNIDEAIYDVELIESLKVYGKK